MILSIDQFLTRYSQFRVSALRMTLFSAFLMLTSACGAGADSHASLEVVTFNLFHVPFHRQARLDAALKTLIPIAPDVVLLQETARGGILAGDPVAQLGEGLGLPFRIYFPVENLGFYRQGLALLSRYPIIESDARLFARNTWYETKGYIWAKIRTPRGDLNVINVHVINQADGRDEPKVSQFRELSALIQKKSVDAPVLLGGDFNAEVTEPGFSEFLKTFTERSLYDDVPLGDVKKTWKGKELLDYFFLIPKKTNDVSGKKLRFIKGGIVVPTTDPLPSDHFPVKATLGEPRP